MNSYKIVYEQHGKYSAIVYPISYVNPIEEISFISLELKEHLTEGSYVLFDLLMSNGDNFNRFAEALFDGGELNEGAVSVVEVSPNELKNLNLYYRGKTKELSRSVLSARERYQYATMK